MSTSVTISLAESVITRFLIIKQKETFSGENVWLGEYFLEDKSKKEENAFL